MGTLIKRDALFLLLLLSFTIAKWPHLHYPFYWDESWSYTPGVRLMYNHGPSLMPNAIDPFYSRGHPLFFYAAAAAWMHLTGGYSAFSAHLFALFVTLCLLVTTYAFTFRFAGRAAALIAVSALMVHVGFFVQATAVVPEMMVALFSLLALSAFASRKWGLAGIALGLLFFTKESGLVAGVVLGVAAGLKLFSRQTPIWEKIRAFGSVALPTLAIGAFFLLQKRLLGWYLYPEHTGLITFEWGPFWGKFQQALSYLLTSELPRWLMYGTFAGAGINALRTRRVWSLLPLFPLGFAFLVGRQKINFLPSALQFSLLAFLLAGSVLFYFWKSAAPAGRKRWVVLLTTFGFLYLCFCSLNFFTLRYLLALLVPLTIGYAVVLTDALGALHPKAVWVAPAIVLAGGFLMFKRDSGRGDTNLQSFNAMRVQQATVKFLEGQKWYHKRIATGSFQDAEHLRKPYTGFRNTAVPFKEVSWDIDTATEVVFFNNIESDARLPTVKADPRFKMVYRVQQGSVWAEVYLRQVQR